MPRQARSKEQLKKCKNIIDELQPFGMAATAAEPMAKFDNSGKLTKDKPVLPRAQFGLYLSPSVEILGHHIIECKPFPGEFFTDPKPVTARHFDEVVTIKPILVASDQ